MHVVTNARFAPDLRALGGGQPGRRVHDDGTTSNEDRLGAIGDVRFVLDRTGWDDDLLVIAGDNLFDYRSPTSSRFWRGKGVASAVAVYDVGDRELAKQYGVVDARRATTGSSASSRSPPTRRRRSAATATTSTTASTPPSSSRYLDEGNPPDQPGHFVAWLHARGPVYGYRFHGEWYDIGDPEQLLEADNRLRRRAGLPERDRYDSTRTRHGSVRSRGLAWAGCSSCCFPSAARSARHRASRSATAAGSR